MSSMNLYDLIWCITCLVGIIAGIITGIVFENKVDKERKKWLDQQTTETKAKIAEYKHIGAIFRKRDKNK